MENAFKERLRIKILSSLRNDYRDNYDHFRFGQPAGGNFFKELIRRWIIYPNYIAKWKIEKRWNGAYNIFANYLDGLSQLHNLLESEPSRKLLVDIIAYRILGKEFVKLEINTPEYWDSIKGLEALKVNKDDFIDTGFCGFRLHRFNLERIGIDAKIYYTSLGIATDFLFEQYAYNTENGRIQANKGDFVIDAGGCWGDTAIYFASKVGDAGRVYSFEFIPGNLQIWKRNMSINPRLAGIIELIERPLWETPDINTYYEDAGPGSRVSFIQKDQFSGSVKTQTIDSFVDEHKIARIDFIKLDIEGAELYALKGALQTLKKFKPKLAIAIYHSMDDFVQIPEWINSLELGYKLYLGHFTIHQEETILFATL